MPENASSAVAAPSRRLAELPESQAAGEVRDIYAAIKRLSGVPMVALIYRHLATIPGALEWSWRLIEPVMQDGSLQRRAWRLAARATIERHVGIPRAALRACGIDEADERAIVAVLDAYNRANPVNILALRCLALQLSGEAVDSGATSTAQPMPPWLAPAEPPPLPEMIDPQAMSPPVRELVLRLTSQDEADGAVLWPSLYRHLARWPVMLGYASLLVLPEIGEIDAVAWQLRLDIDKAAAQLAQHIVRPSDLAPPEGEPAQRLHAAIGQFSQRIPEMVVIGTVLRRALPPYGMS